MDTRDDLNYGGEFIAPIEPSDALRKFFKAVTFVKLGKI
jgi:hypothetical protein